MPQSQILLLQDAARHGGGGNVRIFAEIADYFVGVIQVAVRVQRARHPITYRAVILEQGDIFAPVMKRGFEERRKVNLGDLPLVVSRQQRPQIEKPITRRAIIRSSPGCIELSMIGAINVQLRLEVITMAAKPDGPIGGLLYQLSYQFRRINGKY